MADKLFREYYNELTEVGAIPANGKMIVQTGTGEPERVDVGLLEDFKGYHLDLASINASYPNPTDGDFGYSFDGTIRFYAAFNTWQSEVLSFTPPTAAAQYADLAAMYAAQGAQVDQGIYEVVDASADPAVVARGGSSTAFYRYLGTTNGNLTDYFLLPASSVSTTSVCGSPVEKTGNNLVFTECANYNFTNPLSDQDINISLTGAVKGVVLSLFVNSPTEPNIITDNIILKSGYFVPNKTLIYWFVYFDNAFSLNIQRDSRIIIETPVLSSSQESLTVIQLNWNEIYNAGNYVLLHSLVNDISTATEIYSGSLLTYDHTGRTSGVENFYWLKAVSDNYNFLDSLFSESSITISSQNILFEDDFTGTTIDTAKWDVQSSADIQISQNDKLIFTDLNTKSSSVSTADIVTDSFFDINSQITVFKVDLDQTSNDALYFSMLFKNAANDNRIILESSNSVSNQLVGKVFNSGTSTSTSVINLSISNSFKFVIENGDFKIYYWNTNVWTQIGETLNYTQDQYQLRIVRALKTINGTELSLDNMFITDYDFATLNP